MHRVRQSVNYFEHYGYHPIVVAVKPEYNENNQDPILSQTVPADLEIRWIQAFKSKWTRKIGLGALALRSMFYYWKAGNQLLKEKQVDLIYFSTTMFPLLILGTYWKKKFGVPFVIDMQDPWHSDFYKNKPKSERPPKYWFSYYLNKYTEPIAMKHVAGIVSVSQGYCTMLQERYPNIQSDRCIVIPFGAFPKDFEMVTPSSETKSSDEILCTYIGRGGNDMSQAIRILFGAFRLGLQTHFELFSKIRMKFIGTSYARNNQGKQTIQPIAEELGISDYVYEQTNRISYFDSLQTLKSSDILLIPGSIDPNYTASKLYPYILARKPILAVFSKTSSVIDLLNKTKAGDYVTFDSSMPESDLSEQQQALKTKWLSILERIPFVPATDWGQFAPYTAEEMTQKQASFFDLVLNRSSKK